MAELPVRPESESVKLVSRGPAPVAFTTRKPWSTYWTATFDSSDPTTKNSPAETAVRERVRVYWPYGEVCTESGKSSRLLSGSSNARAG